ncbi:transglutaminase-like domain-containing protein [Streptomyces sp. RB6PN25]|uniref:Transglutaminase-like domain-containing protein n=1 Tax=Streptomyces humicola TaxID=2953240 RepID=A0ABT1PSV0_9ACTN|nr:transglutaminase-like domain-containing protein [Streptomyces humicola]MCQ4080198.1 transglutaminase-like domain-containing protein [Streptomyces humicola]
MDEAGRRQRFFEEVRAEQPNLALLCLLVGAEADPEFGTPEMAACMDELDRLAEAVVQHRVPEDPHDWAEALADVLGEGYGFHGLQSDYRRLDSSLLQHVLRRRRGLPILLSVVWMEVGRRLDAPVYGVALPGHFVVGIGDPDGSHVLADPFRGGQPLTVEDTELLVTGAAGTALAPSMLEPAEPLDIIARILNNIRAWAAARPEHTGVQLWAVDLSLLLPRHPARLRFERAQLLVQRGKFIDGAVEMEEYAQVVEELDPAAAETVRRRARAARAMLN